MRFLSFSSLITFLAYLSLYCLQMDQLADDPGLGWHFKTGELVANTWRIPRADPFLAVSQGASAQGERLWVADQWLSDLIFFWLKSLGGWPTLYVFTAGVWIVTFFAVVGPGVQAQVGGAFVSTLVALIAFKLGQVHFVLRPVVGSIFLFAVVHRVSRGLVKSGELSSGAVKKRLLLLFGVFALWSNLHPAFVLGLFVVFAVAVSSFTVQGWRAPSFVVAWVAVWLCVVATMINPYGWELHRSILQLGTSDYLMSLNTEWQPTDLRSSSGVVLLIMVTLPLICWVSLKSFRQRIPFFDLLVIGGLFLGCIKHVRFIPYVSIAAAYPFAALIRELTGAMTSRSLRLSRRFFKALEEREARSFSSLVTAVVCGLGGFLLLVGPGMPFSVVPGPTERIYSPALIQAIRRDASTGVVFATPDLGGFITANLYPDFRAVIDDRNTLLGEQMYRRYFRAMESAGDLQSLVDDFGVTHVVIGQRQPILAVLKDSHLWPVIYEDEANVVLRVVR